MLSVSETTCTLMPTFLHPFSAVFSKLTIYAENDIQTSWNKLGYHQGTNSY